MAQLRKTARSYGSKLRTSEQYQITIGIKMSNSNGIKAALKVMNRVYELRTAGLKLKESKSALRVILCEMGNELPAEILFNVEQVLKRRSGRDFFNQLSSVIYCAEAALRVAEQMDEKHAEALEMNAAQDMVRAVTETKESLWNAATPFVRCLMRASDHAEALEINTQVDSELAKLCRVIAGVRRTLYKQETKADLIGAACRGVIDGLRQRLGVVISRDMLPLITVRAAK